MTSIFIKDNDQAAATSLLIDILGFLDKSVQYKNIDRFLKNAAVDVANIISKEAYEVIATYFEDETEDDDEKEILEALQYAVAIQGYRNYTPTRDVGHTQNGRRMRLDDHEKQAFEWMLDRDNANMERMYYKAIDQLLELIKDLVEWQESDQYKKLKSNILNTTEDFQSYFNIDHSRLLFLKLQPGIRQCQEMQILPRIGKDALSDLETLTEENEEIIALVKEACVYWSLYWGFNGRLTVTMFPEGILQRFVSEKATTQGARPPLMNEYAWAAQNFKKDAEDLLLKIEQYANPLTADELEEESLDDFGFTEDDNYITT